MYLKFILIFILIVGSIDIYFYYSMRQVVKGRDRKKDVPDWLIYTYWGFSIFTFLFLLFATYFYIAEVPPPRFARIYITGFIFIVFISKIFGILFFLIDDLKNLLIRFKNVLSPKVKSENSENAMSRGTFLKQSGLVASALPFVTMMYGVVKSAFDYNVIKIKINDPSIPSAFNGFKILQISDVHTGSFISNNPLRDAVGIINEQEADVMFFTGDLVNEVAEEALPFIDDLKQVSTKHGVYSTLGNHDYGDYFYQKGDVDGKAHNYALMKDVHHQMNWDLMLNENRVIEKNGQKLGIIGVENWGHNARFQKYGDLNLAMQNLPKTDYNVLLSHDPSHWDARVTGQFKDIDLTLSGHTHGFQMGIEIPGYIKWSPSKYLYKQWAGLYQEGNQRIYVNRGLGFLGYPGRLGILPEITVIELSNNLV